MRRPASTQRGFTLLEVMVALAILAVALVLVGSGIAQNVRQSNHARMVRLATLLMRQKMAQVEADLYETGFSEFTEEESGDFREEGFPSFNWDMKAEKVRLPADIGRMATEASQRLSEQTQQLSQGDSGDTQAMAGALSSSMMSTLLSAFGGIVEQIRVAIEDSMRRITVRISWREPPRSEEITVSAYFIDRTRLALGTGQGIALPGAGGAGGAAGAAGAGGAGGRGAGSGSGSPLSRAMQNLGGAR